MAKKRIRHEVKNVIIGVSIVGLLFLGHYSKYLNEKVNVIEQVGTDCGALEVFHVDSYISYLLK